MPTRASRACTTATSPCSPSWSRWQIQKRLKKKSEWNPLLFLLVGHKSYNPLILSFWSIFISIWLSPRATECSGTSINVDVKYGNNFWWQGIAYRVCRKTNKWNQSNEVYKHKSSNDRQNTWVHIHLLILNTVSTFSCIFKG